MLEILIAAHIVVGLSPDPGAYTVTVDGDSLLSTPAIESTPPTTYHRVYRPQASVVFEGPDAGAFAILPGGSVIEPPEIPPDVEYLFQAPPGAGFVVVEYGTGNYGAFADFTPEGITVYHSSVMDWASGVVVRVRRSVVEDLIPDDDPKGRIVRLLWVSDGGEVERFVRRDVQAIEAVE